MRHQLRKLIRALTQDKGTSPDPPDTSQGVLTVEQIGPKRFKTPEGFLFCREVPIARIGTMMYGPGETPIVEGPDGIAWVTRTANELFRPETITSFEGKPLVDEHPTEDVTPKNWKKLARGVAFNVRQGSGPDADVLLADLLITDEATIAAVDAMKREVSAGYEADYEQTEVGQGDQTNLIGNHIALVERGRCGPRCAIGDHQPSLTEEGNNDMATSNTQRRTPAAKPRVKLSQKVLDALAELSEDPDASTMDEEGGPSDSHTHIHIHGIGATPTGSNGAVDVEDDAGGTGEGSGNSSGMGGGPDAGNYEARFASLENGHKEIITQLAAITQALASEGGSGGEATGDEKKDDEGKTDDEGNPFAKKADEEADKTKTKDSAALETGYQALIADAEVLVPGFRVSTFDAKAKRSATIDTMCNTRRKALDACYATAEGKALVDGISGVKTIDTATMDCASVGVLFRAAAGAKRLLNNSNATRDANRMGQQGDPNAKKSKAPQTIAELNKQNREYYATH